MKKEDKTKELKKIRDEVIDLVDSPLYAYRVENNYFPVLGEGNHDAPIVFIGEAPGKNEAQTGRPFCGRAGKILDELLEGAGIQRGDVYITNIVKDRPQQNRDPLPEEIQLYGPFLDRQLQIIQPKCIATLGRFSMEYIMRHFGLEFELEPISKIHGRVFETNCEFGTIHIIPLYHPAVAIYTRSMYDTLKDDFNRLVKFI